MLCTTFSSLSFASIDCSLLVYYRGESVEVMIYKLFPFQDDDEVAVPVVVEVAGLDLLTLTPSSCRTLM